LSQGIQQLKDQSYDARFIFLAPPEIPELERRLQRRGSDDEDKIKQRLMIAERELEQAKVEGFHDKIFVNDDLEATYRNLESYIFGDEDGSNENAEDRADGSTEVANVEVEMVDAEEASKDEVSAPEKAPALGTDNGTPAAEADPGAIESKDFAK
jgi:THO complex subunit 1